MSNLLPGWTQISGYVLKSPDGVFVNYTKYREETGCCEECGVRMDRHSRCAACTVLAGPSHTVSCSSYRGHVICGYCAQAWARLDRYLERLATWKEFLNPTGLTVQIIASKKATMREVR